MMDTIISVMHNLPKPPTLNNIWKITPLLKKRSFASSEKCTHLKGYCCKLLCTVVSGRVGVERKKERQKETLSHLPSRERGKNARRLFFVISCVTLVC